MNYKEVYDNLVETALSKKRSRKDGNYYESHHIIPKSHGGDNSKENRVLLTPREHFICHRLLCKIYPECPKMKLAIYLMCQDNTNSAKGIKISGRLFEMFKLESAEAKKKLAGFTDNRVEFITPVVCPRGLSTKCYRLNLFPKISKPVRSALHQLITNLLSASEHNGMVYSRNFSDTKSHKKSVSTWCLIKAIDILEELEFITHEKASRSERKRSVVYPTDKLLDVFGKYKDVAIERCGHVSFS